MELNFGARTEADILVEFLEVAFHSILYFRNIYPKSIFCLKKKYQIPVHVSKHPEVNKYITECVKTAQLLLNEDGLKQIAMLVLTEFGVPLEKYCFDLSTSDSDVSDFYFVKTEEVFREYLLKLSVANLNDLPENCTFRIQITTKESCSVQLNENLDQAHFPWIEAEKEYVMEQSFEVFPVKTLDTSLLTLNMYIERENNYKKKHEFFAGSVPATKMLIFLGLGLLLTGVPLFVETGYKSQGDRILCRFGSIDSLVKGRTDGLTNFID